MRSGNSGTLAGELTLANGPVRDGLVASFYPSGQVVSFACYGGGTAAFAWALHLDEGVESGRAVLEHGSGGAADHEVYADGHYERFDAWSDASRPRPLAYAAWVRRWIAEIVDTARRLAAAVSSRASPPIDFPDPSTQATASLPVDPWKSRRNCANPRVPSKNRTNHPDSS